MATTRDDGCLSCFNFLMIDMTSELTSGLHQAEQPVQTTAGGTPPQRTETLVQSPFTERQDNGVPEAIDATAFLESVKHNRSALEDIVQKHNSAVSHMMSLREEMTKQSETHATLIQSKDDEIAQRDTMIAELQQREKERYRKEQYGVKVQALLDEAIKTGKIPAKDEQRIAVLKEMALADEANYERIKVLVQGFQPIVAPPEKTESHKRRMRQEAQPSVPIDRERLRSMTSNDIRQNMGLINQALLNGTLR